MQIQIKNRWDGSVIFEGEFESLLLAVEEAIRMSADLRSANLRGADLGGANLRSANLRSADLRSADLGSADLRSADLGSADLGSANLVGANLRSANLGGANLGGANLVGANLRSANLGGANLRSANLGGANLRSANLGGANLAPIRTDLFDVLLRAPGEVAGLRKAIVEGRINGSVYTGECACLVGTIANVRGCGYQDLGALKPDGSRPAEQWFLGIEPGDTPEKSQIARITVDWVDEFIKLAEGVRSAGVANGR